MAHRDDAREHRSGTSAPESGRAVHDRRWRGDLVAAIRCAAVLLGLLLLIDRCAGNLSPGRGALWSALAVLLFLLLCPDRVRAGEGWLASRRLLRTRRVRTDLLVSVRRLDGITQRLVLRDAFGERVELDPQVLVHNPDLWHRLHEDARRSLAHGTLLCGATALERISQQVERETARAVFEVSDLK
ncbi:hypothetical protein ACFY1L_19835 [Streptomyces sp. NPDC001663]|uniref:hypothetical protein n=1 Tax=Streptomyces sp. NPDC001663 TaxID=3364597 RepID=UPI00369823E1